VEITRRTDYATRILLELARPPEGQRLSARALGSLADVPYPFARSIVTELAAAGLVEARRGPHGGVALARPAAEITLYDVVVATEGGVCLNPCVSDPAGCRRSAQCGAHDVWARAGALLSAFLASKDLATLAHDKVPTVKTGGG
jgi:Rrf2 family protein